MRSPNERDLLLGATLKNENVDHPSHYGGEDNPHEAIKVIEAWNLGFSLGNCVKYLSRAGKKGAPGSDLEDLKKARWYLDREIARRENPVGGGGGGVDYSRDTTLSQYPTLTFKLPSGGIPVKYFDAQIVVSTDWTIQKLCCITATNFNLPMGKTYGISLEPDSGFLNSDSAVSWMLKMWPPETHDYYLRARYLEARDV